MGGKVIRTDGGQSSTKFSNGGSYNVDYVNGLLHRCKILHFHSLLVGKFYICLCMSANPLIFVKQTAKQSLAVLLMVLIPGLTFMHVLSHKRQRKEVKRFLERTVGMELAETLFLPNTAEFAYVKKGSEIVLGENKYDVLQVTAVPGGYRVKAFNDKVEKALENQIAQQTQQGHGGSSQAKPLWFDKLHWAISEITSLRLQPMTDQEDWMALGQEDLLDALLEVSVPPPRGWFYPMKDFIS